MPGIRAARMTDSEAHQVQVPDHRPKNPAREPKRSAVKESRAMARAQNAACAGLGCAVQRTGMAPALRKMQLRRNPKMATATMEMGQARNPQRNSGPVSLFL